MKQLTPRRLYTMVNVATSARALIDRTLCARDFAFLPRVVLACPWTPFAVPLAWTIFDDL